MTGRPAGFALSWTLVAVALACALGFAAYAVAGYPERFSGLANYWLFNGALGVSAAVFFVEAIRRRELRAAWISFGFGLALWTAGNVYFVVELYALENPPYPSPADAGYLLALVPLYVGIVLVARERIGRLTLASWLDGVVGALAAVTLAVAIFAPILIGLTEGNTSTVITNLAYPVGDLLLIAMIVGALVVSGVRGAGTLLLIGAGLAIWTAADVGYLYTEATGAAANPFVESGWPLGGTLMGAGAALASTIRARRGRPVRPGHRSSALVPVAATLIAVAVAVHDHFDRMPEAAIWFGAATLLAVALRLMLSSRENNILLGILHRDSVTDPLTGLANRRQLYLDLDELLERGAAEPSRHLFAILDLDGFKTYNDTYGHPAGDALLVRIGRALAGSVGERGNVYRLGGDEFCILVELGDESPVELVSRARTALTERGEGFTIDASFGVVELPGEREGASEVLRLADQRMYVEKGRRATRAEQQTRDVLLGVLREREPVLGDHLAGVAALALEVVRELELEAEERDVVARAAELHDIGKVAIPDALLGKPGPLDGEEWELVRRHTLIGERILRAAPALGPVATLVRSSHERWDGRGYPEGLSGEGIPLGSRIIFVCDAFDAMTSDRPYRPRLSSVEALAELRRAAGTQFDPTIVDVFARLYERGAFNYLIPGAGGARYGRNGAEPAVAPADSVPSPLA